MSARGPPCPPPPGKPGLSCLLSLGVSARVPSLEPRLTFALMRMALPRQFRPRRQRGQCLLRTQTGRSPFLGGEKSQFCLEQDRGDSLGGAELSLVLLLLGRHQGSRCWEGFPIPEQLRGAEKREKGRELGVGRKRQRRGAVGRERFSSLDPYLMLGTPRAKSCGLSRSCDLSSTEAT